MHFFLIGIKGSGMAALAAILKSLGYEVSGSDVEHHYFTDKRLKQLNISVKPFNKDNITNDIDVVILGNAFSKECEEYQQALKLKIKTYCYYEFVSILASKLNSIAICGTNGKTTTTGMCSKIIDHDKLMYLIGDGSGYSSKQPQYFLFEACEYKEVFLNYHPQVALITNIEMDHPDYFKDINMMVNAYQKFSNNCQTIIVNNDDLYASSIKHHHKITYGINQDSDVRLINLNMDENGCSFQIVYNKIVSDVYHLALFGKHMVYNMLASISVGLYLGIDLDIIIKRLNEFSGVKRRFNIKPINETKHIYLIDDYAHHPTSIKLTLEAIRQKYPHYIISCLFQAHTYSRVALFHQDFAQALSLADNVYIDDIFGSIREQQGDINKQIMIDDLLKYNTKVYDNINFLKDITKDHIIAVLGAGDIDTYMIPKIKDMINHD